MASIAQAVSTSVASITNSPNAEPTIPQSTNGHPDLAAPLTRDTVDLTETGSRNVPSSQVSGKIPFAFQVTYFPPSSSPNAHSQGPIATNAASAAALAASLTQQSATNLSAASQAKLEQLDQVLQRLGINPAQISFADRIALLPLVNDPQAIQQFVQGLPQQTAVLSPATSQVSAPTTKGDQTASSSTSPALATAGTTLAPSAASNAQTGSNGASSVDLAHSAARTSVRNGQNVNISV
jgi:hypothetical protein